MRPTAVDYIRAQARQHANTICVPSSGTVVLAPQGMAVTPTPGK